MAHRSFRIEPEECGLPRHALGALAGGDAVANAGIVRDVLAGQTGGPRDAVLMNAAAALYVAGTVLSLPEGVDHARSAIDSGRAQKVLEQLIAVTNRLVREGREGEGRPGVGDRGRGNGGSA